MRQLYYIFQTLLRGRGSNVVKLISLTLGLLVGILLFSQIVYELNYDTFYKEHERLTMFGTRDVSADGHAGNWEWDTYRPAAAALAESLPDLVECATPVFFWDKPDLYIADKKLEETQVIFGDTLYFRTLGIEVLSGDPQLLAHSFNAFVSQSKARELFGSENPVGKTFNMDKRFDLTVRGVYEDLPRNISFPSNIIISLPTIEDNKYGQGTWNSNDIYMVYVRLRHADDLEEMNRRVTQAVGRYTSIKDPHDGETMECSVIPVEEFYLSSPDNVRRIVILFVLGFSIFFVSGMNYVLAAIATIGRRSKMVGVHKCCGADARHVMGMFLWETGLMILLSILCSLALIYTFRDPIEDMLGLSRLAELFTWQTLWVPVVTVVLLFLVAGLLPGQMFARIPVTQVFRRYTDDKRSWKRGLLFVQFLGVAFILGMLATSIHQYHDLMTRDVGFNSDRLAVGAATGGLGDITNKAEFVEEAQLIADALLRQPFVEGVGRSEQSLLGHYSSGPVEAEGGSKRVQVHFQYFVKGFPEVAELKLIEGNWPQYEGEAIVSEKLVKDLNWGNQVIGRELPMRASRDSKDERAKVVGVIRDVRNMGFFGGQTRVAYILDPSHSTTYHVRIKEPLRENLLRLNDFVKQTYPESGLAFLSYEDVRRDSNASVLRFRNTVYMTSGCILLIVFMGLIGYVSDETQRRSKEIAVRKVNGAEASSILKLLSANILKVAVGAVVIGVVSSWYVSGIWMEQFSDSELLSPVWFVTLAVCLLVVIVLVVVLKAWHIANENPVKSIKSE